jgi:outer membrane protein assembly factor BamB
MLPLLAVALTLSGCGAFGGKHKPKTPTLGNRVPILSRIESSAKVDPRMESTPVTIPAAVANPEWPQAGGSPDKSTGALALAAAPTRIWTASIAGSTPKQRLAAAPVIGDGKLFVIDTDGVVHAFNANTGAALWQQSFPLAKSDQKASRFGGGVSYDSGKVYVDTGLGDVAALDANTGAQAWKVRPAGPLRGSPTVAFNAVYVMTQDNQIVSLDVADGKTLWQQSGATTQAGVFGVAAPAAGQGTVIAGYSSGELVAYRYENGRQLWSDALARTSISTSVGALTDVDADPIIDSGRVYALGQGGRMAAYELVTGQRIWELNLAGISTPSVAGDWIFTLTNGGKLLAIQRATGRVRWLTDLGQYRNTKKKKGEIFWTGPVLAGDRLWLGNSRGQVVAANIADGKTTPMFELKSPISLAPIVANSTLYFIDDGGRISAFR